jgi:dTMP kinase
MLLLFEGIDGSGKTTLSNRVAEALREVGFAVVHTREGGRFASSVTQAIRELGRDARNHPLVPLAELLLYAARDAQLLQEATVPALAKADVVIADRFLYSAEVLARHGRGMAEAEVAAIVRAAAAGVVPDLAFLVDVDPQIARARRRIAKIVVRDDRPSSRKGLSGVGMQHRLRDGYREIAAREPERWIVVDNSDADLGEVVFFMVRVVRAALAGGAAAGIAEARAQPLGAAPALGAAAGPEEAVGALVAWAERRARSEPALAAYFLGGLAGAPVDALRLALAERAPDVLANGLRGLDDAVSWELRRALVARAPRWVARSLGGVGPSAEAAEAWRLREELAVVAPDEVTESIDGRDEPAAWALRDRLAGAAPDAVVASLKRLDGPRAWALRERWLAERGGPEAVEGTYATAVALCASVTGLDGPRAWELRKLARAVAPVAALDSIAGLANERAWKWRRRSLERMTKVALRTIDGMDDPRAWELREAAAPRAKEAVDSMLGLDGERAWALREACADLWPSTVAKSLGPLAASARGAALLRRLLARWAGNLSLVKHAAAIALRAAAPVAGAEAGPARRGGVSSPR